jgi:hypothetical protein
MVWAKTMRLPFNRGSAGFFKINITAATILREASGKYYKIVPYFSWNNDPQLHINVSQYCW